MKKFFKKLSGKTEKKSFKEIPLDRKATYKQQWAVAWRFARECADDFPYQSEKALAVIFNAVIYKYHSDPECNTELTHGDVQEYLSGEKSCPDHYKKLIHINLREELNKSDPDSKARSSKDNNTQRIFDLSDEKKVQQLINLNKKGHTLTDIGNVFGMSRNSVSKYLKKLENRGEDIGNRNRNKTPGSIDLSDESNVQQLLKLYKDGHALSDIGDIFGVSDQSIRNYLKRLKRQTKADDDIKPRQIRISDLSDQKIKEIIHLYDQGVIYKEMSKILNIPNIQYVLRGLKKAGYDIKARGSNNNTDLKFFSLSDERKVRRFIKLYNEGHTLQAIGDTFGMTPASVRNYVKRLKVKGVDLKFRGQGRRTDTKNSFKKRSNIMSNEEASNKKLLNIMNNQKRS